MVPEGVIFSSFDPETMEVDAFSPPPDWPRFVGIDPLGERVAAVWLAWDAGNLMLHVYREYYEPFGISTPEHVANILRLSRGEFIVRWVGGGPSERQVREDWRAAGIPLQPAPISDVWQGIDRIQSLFQERRILVHRSCPNLLSELGQYRRKVVDGQPSETIIEDKGTYHAIDSVRYVVSWLTHGNEMQRVVFEPPMGQRV